MKSFLCKGKKPIIKWGMLPDNIFYKGEIPEGYSLAISPSKGYIIIDVDKHGKQNGFSNIPSNIIFELKDTLNYKTKNDGRHFWIKYTGNIDLPNKSSSLGIDLRTHKGYVVWYLSEDIQDRIQDIKESSPILNEWLEITFARKGKKETI